MLCSPRGRRVCCSRSGAPFFSPVNIYSQSPAPSLRRPPPANRAKCASRPAAGVEFSSSPTHRQTPAANLGDFETALAQAHACLSGCAHRETNGGQPAQHCRQPQRDCNDSTASRKRAHSELERAWRALQRAYGSSRLSEQSEDPKAAGKASAATPTRRRESRQVWVESTATPPSNQPAANLQRV